MFTITPGADLTLRPIRPDDEATLLGIFASTREEERQQLGWDAPAWDAFIRQQFEAQHRQYMTAYAHPAFSLVLLGGEAAGRLYVDRGSEEIRIVDIALLPPYRRQGLGRRLLQALADEADASGLPLGLHVEKNNPALGWYRRLGFAEQADRGVYLYLQRPPVPVPGIETLAAQAGSDFALCLPGGGTVALRLQDIVRQPHASSLHFTGPDLGRPAHATYTLAHPLLGRFPLFLGPVMGGAAGEVCYQAIVTHLNPSPAKEPTP